MFHQISSDTEILEFLRILPRIMDFSCIRTMHDKKELDDLINASREYRPACAFVLPSITDYLIEHLKDIHEVKIGGTIGFPSGGDLTRVKVFQTEELCRKGCGELDMVMNLTLFKTGQYGKCLKDIQEVVNTADGIPVKVIIEASILTEEEICRASELAVKGGAAFVKTGTGWVGATTVDQVGTIYKAIGNDAFIKAAGGIRSLAAVKELYEAGCDRFGIGAGPAVSILKEAGQQDFNQLK